MDDAPSLSICLPAHDEAARLDALLESLPARLGPLVPSFEAVVADDGSRDDTPDVLERWSRRHSWLRSVRHDRRRGYGAAARAALDAARGDRLLLCDADGQFDPADAEHLLAHADSYDLVVGERVRRADSLPRVVTGRAWSLAARALFGELPRDVDCGFKLTGRTAWRRVSPTLHSTGATFSVEWLVSARRLGLTVKDVPISHLPRRGGRATGLELRVVLRAVIDLVRLRLRGGASADRSSEAR